MKRDERAFSSVQPPRYVHVDARTRTYVHIIDKSWRLPGHRESPLRNGQRYPFGFYPFYFVVIESNRTIANSTDEMNSQIILDEIKLIFLRRLVNCAVKRFISVAKGCAIVVDGRVYTYICTTETVLKRVT